jgi:hypothetical protein
MTILRLPLRFAFIGEATPPTMRFFAYGSKTAAA